MINRYFNHTVKIKTGRNGTMKIKAVCNQKGGVGKSSVTANLARTLAENGYKVGVIDFDPQANSTGRFDVDSDKYSVSDLLLGRPLIWQSSRGVSILPSDSSLSEFSALHGGKYDILKNLLGKYDLDFDYLFIDTPPSQAWYMLNGIACADDILIVTTPTKESFDGILEMQVTIKRSILSLKPLSGVIINNVMKRTNLHTVMIEEIHRHLGETVFKAQIPANLAVSESYSFNTDVITHAPRSKAALAFKDLSKEFIRRESR